MSKAHKRRTRAEKLAILEHYKREGLVKTTRAYGVSSTSIYKWQRDYDTGGIDGLSADTRQGQSQEQLELARLRRENAQLKTLVADKELRLLIQEEMLKKTPFPKPNV